jgi:hypothetical protein
MGISLGGDFISKKQSLYYMLKICFVNIGAVLSEILASQMVVMYQG